jgi:hypothetical protein
MTREEMNQLRPGDKVFYEAAKVRTLGTVKSVWRNSHLVIHWKGESGNDEIQITEKGEHCLKKAQNV